MLTKTVELTGAALDWAAKHGEQHEARDTFNSYGEHYGEAYEVTLDRCSYGPHH